jgi:hypothetical protein
LRPDVQMPSLWQVAYVTGLMCPILCDRLRDFRDSVLDPRFSRLSVGDNSTEC